MRKRAWTVFLATLLFAGPASAEEVLKPRTEGGISFVSGGIGRDEREALKKIEDDYNLRLLFAARDYREYLADIRVTIRDADGKIILEAVADGPRFLARLAPGTYSIGAANEGRRIVRSVTILPDKAVTETFTWKISYPDNHRE